MSKSILDQRVTAQALKALAKKGFLTEDALEHALRITGEIPTRQRWAQYVQRLFLGLGWTMLVAGIFFFFAYNWASLSNLIKFLVVESLLVASLVLAWYKGLDHPVGQFAAMGATCLVGVFLALFGQVYQTGADAYELFATWSLLVVGWVILSRFNIHALLYLVLLNVSLGTFIGQVILPGGGNGLILPLLLAVLNGLALILWEVGKWRKWTWVRSGWIIRLIAFALLVLLTALLIAFIWGQSVDPILFYSGIFLYLGVLGAFFYRYKVVDLDQYMLALCAFSLIALMVSLLSKWMGTEWWSFLVIGVLVILSSAFIARWLMSLEEEKEVAV